MAMACFSSLLQKLVESRSRAVSAQEFWVKWQISLVGRWRSECNNRVVSVAHNTNHLCSIKQSYQRLMEIRCYLFASCSDLTHAPPILSRGSITGDCEPFDGPPVWASKPETPLGIGSMMWANGDLQDETSY
jgi:hypothetical protein